MSNHTAGKWFVYSGNRTLIVSATNIEIADTCSRDLFPEEQHANAAFIVRAVNSHDQLVAALRRLIASNEAYSAVHASDGDDVARMIEWAEAFDDASALLAKIEA